MSGLRSDRWRTYVPEFALLLTLVAAPMLLPHFGFSHDLLTRVLNWGLIGLGFDILFGLTGLLSFGQAAFYGAGGFVTAYLLVSGMVSSVWLALALGDQIFGNPSNQVPPANCLRPCLEVSGMAQERQRWHQSGQP